MRDLAQLAEIIARGPGLVHKADIATVTHMLAPSSEMSEQGAIMLGDDCAAIPDGDGYLLLAIEGFVNEFVNSQPWFAGYCGVMVNLSDIYSMGGRPIAVVDAVWSQGAEQAHQIVDGLRSASTRYGVPIVGGHSNLRTAHAQLAVGVLGRAKCLLSGFEAKKHQSLLAAIDLRGAFREPYPNWDASTHSPADRLKEDLEILPELAESGLCAAAKDISMAGVLGTVLMLLESSGLGGVVDINAIPRPDGVCIERWLKCFPSYGFVLSVDDKNVKAVINRFHGRDIACAVIGTTDETGCLHITDGDEKALVWDLSEHPLTGCGPQVRQGTHS